MNFLNNYGVYRSETLDFFCVPRHICFIKLKKKCLNCLFFIIHYARRVTLEAYTDGPDHFVLYGESAD